MAHDFSKIMQVVHYCKIAIDASKIRACFAVGALTPPIAIGALCENWPFLGRSTSTVDFWNCKHFALQTWLCVHEFWLGMDACDALHPLREDLILLMASLYLPPWRSRQAFLRRRGTRTHVDEWPRQANAPGRMARHMSKYVELSKNVEVHTTTARTASCPLNTFLVCCRTEDKRARHVWVGSPSS